MTGSLPSKDQRDRRPSLAFSVLRWILRLLVVGAIFGLGVALGEALHDNPDSGGSRTYVRTLRPLPLAPAPQTVTVTTTVRR